jgi:hypothetical protein
MASPTGFLFEYGGLCHVSLFEEFIRPENATDALLNPVQIGLLAALPVLIGFALRKISKDQAPKAFPFARVLSVLLPLLVIFLCRIFGPLANF